MTLRTLAACVLLALAPAALAQSGSMSMGLYGGDDSFRPDLSSRDLKVIVRVLHLQPEAEKALMDLYAGYDGSLQNEGAAVKDFVNEHIEKAEIMQNTDLLGPAHAKLAKWRERSEQIKKTFLEDLKSLLTTDQEARWPIVERELRRMKYVGSGKLCGESIDLVRMTEDVLGKESPPQELADLLNRYSDDLDHAMVARQALLDEKQKDYEEKCKSDPKAAEAIWKDVQHARAAVRDVNDRYVRLIAAQLSPDKAADLSRKYFDQSFRPITKPTRLDDYVKDVGELKTLTPSQESVFKTIKAKYETDRRAVQERQAKAWRDFEMDWKPEGLAQALGEQHDDPQHQRYNGAWLPETHPLIQTRKERLELDQQVRKSLDALLTEEQRTAIPSRLTPYARFDNWSPWGL
jgi:Skp family chaperone for outer membrane proteins